MSTVYIETSIVSYLREDISSDVIAASRQLLTHRWWNTQRHKYDLVTSQLVVDEAGKGNNELATERLVALEGIPRLELVAEISIISDTILRRAVLPPKALLDSLHIAAAAYHQVDYASDLELQASGECSCNSQSSQIDC